MSKRETTDNQTLLDSNMTNGRNVEVELSTEKSPSTLGQEKQDQEDRTSPLANKKKGAIILSIAFAALTIAFVLSIVFVPSAMYKAGAPQGIKKEGSITGIITVYTLSLITLVMIYYSKVKQRKNERHFFTTKNITRTSVFSALSIVLYYFVKVSLPIFPSFLDLQFSDLPALLAGYMMGPIGGCIVIIIKFLVKLPASTSFYVGELVDLALGLSFVLTSTLIYGRKRTIKNAAFSLAIGSIVCVAVAALLNRFVAVPLYLWLLFDNDWSKLLKPMNALFNNRVTEENFYAYYIFLSVIPFNLLRCLVTSVLTFFSYKSLKKLFDRLSS